MAWLNVRRLQICISHVCTDIASRNIPACPRGSNRQICSGNGVCVFTLIECVNLLTILGVVYALGV